MRALVVYESMYGNTRRVAEAIAKGMVDFDEVEVAPLDQATPVTIEATDLLVVGGPTHVHGISRAATRKAAVDAAQKTEDLALDDGAPGYRDARVARFDALGLGTGCGLRYQDRCAGLAHRPRVEGHRSALRKHGFTLLDRPTSFLVTKQNTLVEGEIARSEAWGTRLGTMLRSSRDRLRS